MFIADLLRAVPVMSMMNGSATILEDDSSRVLDKSAEPKKSVKSRLVSGVTGLFGGNSRSINWSEFVNSYLSLNLVERLEVSHDGWAKVILRSKQEENKSTKTSSSPEASTWLSMYKCAHAMCACAWLQ